ncbi:MULTISPECIES: protein sip-5 [unclassified Stenotrophomonas]|uniref:protein sip-5 n=1 Tax=unclassified Stenotrophomonas TaxID=196198 RepID=UPI0025F00D7A|nr:MULTISPECIES: protein sip-5 [unclassified Stenotrophomonas]
MNFEALQRRVRRAEAVVQIRAEETTQSWQQLDRSWRSAWTPGRIIVVGLAGGFLAGKLEPGGAFSGARWLQMIGSVSGLVASAQASVASFAAAAAGMAASHAADAADDADEAAADAEQAAAPAAASARAAAPGNANPVPPRAAEAATELSES